MNDPQLMTSHRFPIWPPPPEDQMAAFQSRRPVFSSAAPAPAPKRYRGHWKGKKPAAAAGGAGGGRGYQPPALSELQSQNRAKARRFFHPKRKFTRDAPLAPRNTTSFIIRAKRCGGLPPPVSPCPVTPSAMQTPTFSPLPRDGFVRMAKEELGVDIYGTMKGIIRLRSRNAARPDAGEEAAAEGDGSGSSESEVDENVEMERRVEHDLSRFELVFPGDVHEEEAAAGVAYLLEKRVDEQDTHIVELEEENMTLKGRLVSMEQEIGDLRRRLEMLETSRGATEVTDNGNAADSNKDAVEAVAETDVCGGDVGSEKSKDSGGDGCVTAPAQ